MLLPWALLAGVLGLRGAAAAGPSVTLEVHLLVRGAPTARVCHHVWVRGSTSPRPCGGPETREAAGTFGPLSVAPAQPCPTEAAPPEAAVEASWPWVGWGSLSDDSRRREFPNDWEYFYFWACAQFPTEKASKFLIRLEHKGPFRADRFPSR